MNVTPEVLAEMRRRHLNATAAPWVVEEHIDGILTVETSNEAIWKRLDIFQISIRGKERLRGENNGRFIALVRNNIGALLDELEAVKAERDRARQALQTAEAEARRYAESYPQSSDGRNTFVMLADRIAELGAAP